jgi:hypothetical protein
MTFPILACYARYRIYDSNRHEQCGTITIVDFALFSYLWVDCLSDFAKAAFKVSASSRAACKA